jgi:hypothetical protein
LTLLYFYYNISQTLLFTLIGLYFEQRSFYVKNVLKAPGRTATAYSPKPTISGSYSHSEPPFGSAAIAFSGGASGTFIITGTMLGFPIQASGAYTATGNKIACTTTASNDPEEIGNKDTFTIIDANTIRDDDRGDLWKKKWQALFCGMVI